MRKNFLTILALIAVCALGLTGCGGNEAAETTAASASTEAAAPAPLGLTEWTMTTTTWSSPNGATVNLTATPTAYEEGQSASFVVRLESDEVANVPCAWDGTHYTAAAELNAADGLCYYVMMTAADGNTAEVPVNTPSAPTDETLINLAASLNSYCNVMVEESSFADGKLTITSGTVQVQAPKITNEGKAVTCKDAVLVLSLNGEALESKKLTLNESEAVGGYELALSDIRFAIPELENDQQLTLTLNVTLSNGQTLSDAGSTFYYNEGSVLNAVG